MHKTDYHEYRRRRISVKETFDDLLQFPRFLENETVNTCNARCPMCTIDEWNRQSPTMKDSLFLKITSDIRSFAPDLKHVSLYRDGEPLLDKNYLIVSQS
jgi:sulfatase maturation enzyme AslB (radical SAM superfamily)